MGVRTGQNASQHRLQSKLRAPRLGNGEVHHACGNMRHPHLNFRIMHVETWPEHLSCTPLAFEGAAVRLP